MKRILVALCTLQIFASVSMADTVNYLVIQDQARPFQIEEQGENHRGVITEVVQEIFKDSPHQLKIHTFPIQRMLSSIRAKEIDNWLNYGTPSWGSPQRDNLSTTSVFTVNHVLLMKQETSFTVAQVEDLFGKSVVLLSVFAYPGLDDYLDQKKVQEVRVKDYGAAFRFLDKSLPSIGFVEMELRIRYNLQQESRNLSHYRLADLSFVIPNYDIFLSIDSTMPASLQRFINERLIQLKASGIVDQILKKYIP